LGLIRRSALIGLAAQHIVRRVPNSLSQRAGFTQLHREDVQRNVEAITERFRGVVDESVAYMERSTGGPDARTHERVARVHEMGVAMALGTAELEEEIQPYIAGKLVDGTQRPRPCTVVARDRSGEIRKRGASGRQGRRLVDGLDRALGFDRRCGRRLVGDRAPPAPEHERDNPDDHEDDDERGGEGPDVGSARR